MPLKGKKTALKWIYGELCNATTQSNAGGYGGQTIHIISLETIASKSIRRDKDRSTVATRLRMGNRNKLPRVYK